MIYLDTKGTLNEHIIYMVEEGKSKNMFPGLKVGSLNEVSTAGKWEK